MNNASELLKLTLLELISKSAVQLLCCLQLT